VEEDITASEMWQEIEGGHADGFQFLFGNVMVFVLCSCEAACFKYAV
jgi:hypothetical protein